MANQDKEKSPTTGKKTISGPPQRWKTRGPAPTSPVGGRNYRPPPKPVEIKSVRGIPRLIDGSRLMACAELFRNELDNFIKTHQLTAIKRDGGKYSPYFDLHLLEELQFSTVEVLEAEEKGLLYLGNSWDIQQWRETYQKAQDSPTSDKHLPKSIQDGDFPVAAIELMKDAGREVELIYEAIKEGEGYGHDSQPKNRQQSAIDLF